MNIIYSTTRQWNPGDEIILYGVRNIFSELNIPHNPIIYNRNPDIHPLVHNEHIFSTSKVNAWDFNDPDTNRLLGRIRFGFFDNSLHPNQDAGFADWVVFAGTPEWNNKRLEDLYSIIIRYDIPVLILGIGSAITSPHAYFNEVISKTKAFTVRSCELVEKVQENFGICAEYLPCPSLLAVPAEKEKQIECVKKIALIYCQTHKHSVLSNEVPDEVYHYVMEFYRKLIAEYSQIYEFELVSHYVMELPVLCNDFPEHRHRYSYDALDYLDIYKQYDFIVGPRVHGIAAAASLGIPGLGIKYDDRGGTLDGFLADSISCGTPLEDALKLFQTSIESVPQKNETILRHKRGVMDKYKVLVAKAMSDDSVSYDKTEAPVPHPQTTVEELLKDGRRQAAEFEVLLTDIVTVSPLDGIACDNDVINAYRLILGREPETPDIVKQCSGKITLGELRNALFESQEFKNKVTIR